MTHHPNSPLVRMAFSLLLCTTLSMPVIASEALETPDVSRVVVNDQKKQQEFPLLQFRKFTGPKDNLKTEEASPYGLADIHAVLKKNYAKDFNFLNTIQAQFYETLYPTPPLPTTEENEDIAKVTHGFQERLQQIYESFITQIYAEFGTYHTLTNANVSEPQRQSEFLMRTHTLKDAAVTSGIYAAVAYAQQKHLGGFDIYHGQEVSFHEPQDNDLARYQAAAEKRKQEIELQYQEKIAELRTRQEKLCAEKEKQQNRNTQVKAPLQELDKQFHKLEQDIASLERECLAQKNSVDRDTDLFTKEIIQHHARTQSAAHQIFRSFGFTGGLKSLSSALKFVIGAPDAYTHFDQLVYTYPQDAIQAVQLFWNKLDSYESGNPLASDLKDFLRSHSTFEEQLKAIIQRPIDEDAADAEVVQLPTTDAPELPHGYAVVHAEQSQQQPKQPQLQKKTQKAQPKKAKKKKKR